MQKASQDDVRVVWELEDVCLDQDCGGGIGEKQAYLRDNFKAETQDSVNEYDEEKGWRVHKK